MIRTLTRSRSSVLAVLAGLAILTVAACGHDEVRTLDRPTPDPVSVTVSTSAAGGATSSVTGTVEADRIVQISTRLSGTVRSVAVDVGDVVGTGAPLLQLETADLAAQLSAAEAEQRIATATVERIRALAADGAASRQELDELEARKARADAAVAEVRAQFEYAVVRAPFSGTVETRTVDPGDLAAPGRPLLTLVSDGEPRVRFDLPASLAGEVAVGDEVTVHRPGTGPGTAGGTGVGSDPGTGWSGRAVVTRVSPALDVATRRRPVEAEFTAPPGDAVIPGAFVRVELGRGETSSLWIPADAIVRRGQLTGVFSVESDTLRLRWVRLGRTTSDAVEVLAGPGGTLTVVRNPAASLVDGAPVERADIQPWSPGDATPGASGTATASAAPGESMTETAP